MRSFGSFAGNKRTEARLASMMALGFGALTLQLAPRWHNFAASRFYDQDLTIINGCRSLIEKRSRLCANRVHYAQPADRRVDP
jgi:hypothetical protein